MNRQSLTTFAFAATFSIASFMCQSAAAESSSSSVGTFVLPSGSVPTEIFGNKCVFKPADEFFAARLNCKGADVSKDPSIIVSVVDSKCQKTSQEMAEARRNSVNDGTPFFNVVWEHKFVPASVPNGKGYRGFFQKSMGNRYWWETCGQGKLTRVSVIMFAPTNNHALKADIEEKIFGVVKEPEDLEQ